MRLNITELVVVFREIARELETQSDINSRNMELSINRTLEKIDHILKDSDEFRYREALAGLKQGIREIPGVVGTWLPEDSFGRIRRIVEEARKQS